MTRRAAAATLVGVLLVVVLSRFAPPSGALWGSIAAGAVALLLVPAVALLAGGARLRAVPAIMVAGAVVAVVVALLAALPLALDAVEAETAPLRVGAGALVVSAAFLAVRRTPS